MKMGQEGQLSLVNESKQESEHVYLHGPNMTTGYLFQYDATHDVWFQPTFFTRKKVCGYYQYDINQTPGSVY
ncbi:hypothetical protein [Peribacillus loiseleuriae]|uniref:hypothetical protein n=1 Tax=Peribacillus loiseleuriae TaxID=1679170 RepID=UPI003D06236D